MIYRAKYILTMAGQPIKGGEIFICDGMIAAVGHRLSELHPNEPVRDLGNCALLPGFVNAHSHIDSTLRRNICDALNLWDWLDEAAYGPGRPAPGYDVMLASAKLGAVECARSGITCLGDCTFSGASVEAMDAVGLRGVVYKEMFGQSMGAEYLEKFARVLDQVGEMQAKCSERIKAGISPHSIYTTNQEVLKLCSEACANLSLPVSLHLAETSAEVDYTMYGVGPIADMRRRLDREPMVSGLRPAKLLEDTGLLQEGVCLAHCVCINHDEVKLISTSGAGVAHCARSNAYLGAGIAPVINFMEAGAAIGLGTDGAGSCGTYDFFDEMRTALALQRAYAKDAGVITAKDVLRLATIGGAQALGLGKQIGTLERGKRADMVAVDMGGVFAGEELELAIIMRSPSNVVLTMVDGIEIISNGHCDRVDIAECEAKVDEVTGE